MFIHWSLCKPCLICWFNWQIWSGASHRAYLHISLCRHLSVSIQSRNSSVKIEAREWLFVYMFIQFWIIANIPSRGLSLWLKYLKKIYASCKTNPWKFTSSQIQISIGNMKTYGNSFCKNFLFNIRWLQVSEFSYNLLIQLLGSQPTYLHPPPSGHLFKAGLFQS